MFILISSSKRKYKIFRSLIPKSNDYTINAIIKCGEEFNIEREIQKLQYENEACSSVSNSQSKDKCNNINILSTQYEFCFLDFSSWEGRWEANSPDEINLEGFEQARLKNRKMLTFSGYLSGIDEAYRDTEILQNLNYIFYEQVSKIECKTFTKTLNFSTI